MVLLNVLHIGPLKTEDRLVIIAHHENIRAIPITDQQVDQLILRTAGILIFVYQHILVTLLVIEQEILVVFKCIQHPEDHVVIIITTHLAHQLLIVWKLIGSSTQFFVVFFQLGIVWFPISWIIIAAFAAITVSLIIFRTRLRLFNALQVLINFLADELGRPVLPLHGREQALQAPDLIVHLPPETLQRMVFAKTIHQLAEQVHTLQIGNGIQLQLAKIIQVFLDDIITKSVESIDVYPVGLRTNKFEQTFAHGYRTRIGIGQT